jgi:hypothetical protein
LPVLSLTTFVDFISTTGLPRVRVVETARREGNQPYDPRRDFYKRLRDSAVAFAKGNISEDQFREMPPTLSDRKKQTNFPPAVKALTTWWARNGGAFRAPPRGEFVAAELRVTVNPEICFTSAVGVVAAKCWFKTEPVPRARLNYILATLKFGMPVDYQGDVGILDVRRGVLHRAGAVDPALRVLLRGEAAGFMTMWDELGE